MHVILIIVRVWCVLCILPYPLMDIAIDDEGVN